MNPRINQVIFLSSVKSQAPTEVPERSRRSSFGDWRSRLQLWTNDTLPKRQSSAPQWKLWSGGGRKPYSERLYSTFLSIANISKAKAKCFLSERFRNNWLINTGHIILWWSPKKPLKLFWKMHGNVMLNVKTVDAELHKSFFLTDTIWL